MFRQYQFAKDATDRGETVLVYNRKDSFEPVKYLTAENFQYRVKFDLGSMFVDGKNVKGWTMAVKP